MKYLELIKGQFTADHEARAKQLEPYVAYSEEADGVMYNFIPEPVVGPADNEIWYTTSNGVTITPQYLSNFGAGFVENVYEDGKGILRFNGPVTHIPGNSNSRIISQDLAGAFRGCSSLTSITIPNSVTSIGSEAFYNCSSLTSITIPNSVTSIGGSAFYGCSSLTKTNYTGDITGWCNIKFGNDYANPMYYSHNFYINDQEIRDLVIPNSVDTINNYAFYNCSSLTSVTIPNSVTSIEASAFDNCSGLTKTNYTGDIAGWCNISFGSTYANPMYYSHNFYINDQEIRDLVIPNGMTSIGGYYTFSSCSSLTSVTIPNSVTVIGWGAFRDCSSITSITFEGTVEEWNTITKNTLWNDNVPATYVQCTDGQVAL